MLILFSLIINSVFYYCIYYIILTFAFVICSNKREFRVLTTWFLKSTMTFIMTSVSVGSMYSVPLAPFFSHVSNALWVLYTGILLQMYDEKRLQLRFKTTLLNGVLLFPISTHNHFDWVQLSSVQSKTNVSVYELTQSANVWREKAAEHLTESELIAPSLELKSSCINICCCSHICRYFLLTALLIFGIVYQWSCLCSVNTGIQI